VRGEKSLHTQVSPRGLPWLLLCRFREIVALESFAIAVGYVRTRQCGEKNTGDFGQRFTNVTQINNLGVMRFVLQRGRAVHACARSRGANNPQRRSNECSTR